MALTPRRARTLAKVLVAAVALVAAANVTVAWRMTAAAHRAVAPPPGVAVAPWPVPGDPPLAGWITAAPSPRAVVVFAHGYRGDRRQGDVLARPLAERGMRLAAFDFRGHGESGGDEVTLASRERGDVARALLRARREGLPVAWVGFSMGAAAYLLSGAEADAAVLDSPYEALGPALRYRFGAVFAPMFPLAWDLIAWRIGRPLDAIRPVDRAAGLRRPTRFVFAERDNWVPPDAQLRYRANGCARCEFVLLRGAEHGDHLTAAWARDVAAYLDRALPRPAAP